MANKLKVIDTHFHIWDLEKQDLPWLAGVPETIKKTFTIQQYIENYEKIKDIDFVGGIYVEVDGKILYKKMKSSMISRKIIKNY